VDIADDKKKKKKKRKKKKPYKISSSCGAVYQDFASIDCREQVASLLNIVTERSTEYNRE
jgi:hypothetical protein